MACNHDFEDIDNTIYEINNEFNNLDYLIDGLSEIDQINIRHTLMSVFFEIILLIENKEDSLNIYGILNDNMKSYLRLSIYPDCITNITIKSRVKFYKNSIDNHVLITFDSRGFQNAKDIRHIYIKCNTLYKCLKLLLNQKCEITEEKECE